VSKKSRALIIGDAHLKISNIDVARDFISQSLDLIRAGKYDKVILLGDQYDSFAIIRSEIQSLWTSFFTSAIQYTNVIALVGNHDLSGVDGGTNPMEPFKAYPRVKIVDEPQQTDGIYYAPFMRDNAAFEAYCRSIPAGSVLICHQSFNGAQFENGFYDPHGADPACVAHLSAVISGHVHKRQHFLNIWYPGTPFQHSFGDAGEKKLIHEVTLEPTGYSAVAPLSLNLPTYNTLEAGSLAALEQDVGQLVAQASQAQLAAMNLKVIARGTPSEITAFWSSPAVKHLKQDARRVVDGLTSARPTEKLPGMTAKTHKEKLYEFIEYKGKSWRTNWTRVAHRAEELLAQ